MDQSFILTQLGEERERYQNAVTPPLFQSSNFTFADVASMRSAIKDELNNSFYTRGSNPTTDILRKKIAALEGAENALMFGSGAAAAAAAFFSQLNQGDHVVSVSKPYSWTNKLLTITLPRFGIETTFIDGTDVANYEAAIQANTKVLYLESPNSLTFEMQDIKAVCALAKSKGITTIIDNSWASPLFQKPIEMGADIVFHSATKYLGGHSDLVAGALCASDSIIRKIFHEEFMTFGGILSPHDAWLLLRSIRTLPIRMERVEKTTADVIQFLKKQPKVAKVYYPLDPDFPQYELAKAQMTGGSGLFSIELNVQERSEIDAFCNELKAFILACSWGGYESLVFPICGLDDADNYKENDLPWNLIRLSIGLEDADHLIADLKAAFAVL